MRIGGWLGLVCCTFLSLSAHADKIKIGGHSGRAGYYALIGVDFGTRVDLLVMTTEAKDALAKAAIPAMGATKDCEVDGLQQSIGTQTLFTVFKIRSCK